MTTTKALDVIRSAGQMQAIRFGQPDGTAREALDDLVCKGYCQVSNAVQVLVDAGLQADLDRTFWAGYRDGSLGPSL